MKPGVFFFILIASLTARVSAAEPTIEPVDCAEFTLVKKVITATCGYLHVPENRAASGGRMIAAAFLIAKSQSATPAPDPLVIMTGGPGGRAIPTTLNGHPALAKRDVIWLEQRGTALTKPSLQCPEYVEASRLAAVGAIKAGDLAGKRIAAAKLCADRARAAGVDLSGYTSREMAADLDDLRRLLGFKRVNLFGVSYSGRVMAEAARAYPRSVRSIILNTPLSAEVNYDEYGSSNMRRTLNMVFDGCAVQPDCAAAFPNVRRQFFDLVTAAQKKPKKLRIPDPSNEGEEITISVTGWVMANAILDQLYSPWSFERLPATIDAIHSGDSKALAGIIDISPSRMAWLMRIAVWCNEEYPFEDKAAIRRQRLDFPEFAGVDQSTVPVGVCEAAGFGGVEPPAQDNEPVETDTPALIMSGAFDPATPPAWQAAMAAHMPNAQLAVFPGGGHVAGFTQCGADMLLAFLDAPMEPIDASCLLKPQGADFSRTLDENPS